MTEKSAEEFKRFTEQINAAVSESRFEDAMSSAIKGVQVASMNNDSELADSLLSVIRGIVIVMENEFGSPSYKDRSKPLKE